MEHVCHLVFLQVQHRSWHTTWIDAPEILLVPRNTLPVHFTASPEFRVHSYSLELFSSCIPLRIFLASVPDSELSLMRKVNTAYRGWMPIVMLKLIITRERFSSVGNHKDNNLVCVNFFLLTGDSEIAEDGILQARILECAAFPFSKDLPNPQIEPRSPTLQADSLPAEPQGKPKEIGILPHLGKSIRSILLTWITVEVRSTCCDFRRREWSWSVFPDTLSTNRRKKGYWLQLGLWIAGQSPRKFSLLYLEKSDWFKIRHSDREKPSGKKRGLWTYQFKCPQRRICSTKIYTLVFVTMVIIKIKCSGVLVLEERQNESRILTQLHFSMEQLLLWEKLWLYHQKCLLNIVDRHHLINSAKYPGRY